MTAPGVTLHPDSTLVDRALRLLTDGPADSERLTRDILGIPRAGMTVADRLVVALLGADPRVARLGDGRWALLATPLGSPQIQDCSFAVVDVETTGSVPAGDRITEIAVISVRNGRVETAFESLVNPVRAIPRAVTAVTRITDEMVRDQPTFAEIADDVFAALAGQVFVAHNVGFDWRFLAQELKRARGLALHGPRVCTVKLARRLIPGLKSRSLDSLAHYFGLEIEQRHRAGHDARATATILGRLLSLASEAGAGTLQELAALCDRRRGRRRRRKRRARPTSMDEI
jgi:DNA polymerase-3 subunit epsilon